MEKQRDYDIIPVKVDVASDLRSINFYLLKTADSLALVDAGLANENFYDALLETLHSNGLSLDDMTGIILTHNHGDHVGLVNRITKDHPIPVYAHSDAIPRLKRDPHFFEMRIEFFSRLYDEMGCGDAGNRQVEFLKKAMVKNQNQSIQTEITPIKESHLGFQVIHTPGHAQDHIVLYHKGTFELLAGDLLISHISSNALVEPDLSGHRLKTLLQHKQSMEKIRELPVKRTYPGHGVTIKDTEQLIDRRLSGIERKADKLKKMLEDKQLTASEMAQIYYRKLYEKEFSLVMSEIIGHLDYLEDKQQVGKEMIDGVWYYSINE